jgi:hypothetical protein
MNNQTKPYCRLTSRVYEASVSPALALLRALVCVSTVAALPHAHDHHPAAPSPAQQQQQLLSSMPQSHMHLLLVAIRYMKEHLHRHAAASGDVSSVRVRTSVSDLISLLARLSTNPVSGLLRNTALILT